MRRYRGRGFPWRHRSRDLLELETSHGLYRMHRVRSACEPDVPAGWYFWPPDTPDEQYPGYFLARGFREAWRSLDRLLMADIGHRDPIPFDPDPGLVADLENNRRAVRGSREVARAAHDEAEWGRRESR